MNRTFFRVQCCNGLVVYLDPMRILMVEGVSNDPKVGTVTVLAYDCGTNGAKDYEIDCDPDEFAMLLERELDCLAVVRVE